MKEGGRNEVREGRIHFLAGPCAKRGRVVGGDGGAGAGSGRVVSLVVAEVVLWMTVSVVKGH